MLYSEICQRAKFVKAKRIYIFFYVQWQNYTLKDKLVTIFLFLDINKETQGMRYLNESDILLKLFNIISELD